MRSNDRFNECSGRGETSVGMLTAGAFWREWNAQPVLAPCAWAYAHARHFSGVGRLRTDSPRVDGQWQAVYGMAVRLPSTRYERYLPDCQAC